MLAAIVVGTMEVWDCEDTRIGKYRGFHTSYSACNKEIDELEGGGIQMWYDYLSILHTKQDLSSDVDAHWEGH